MTLYAHQAAMWLEREAEGVFLLAAKTGMGKTRAAIWPAIAASHSVLAVYPTNALVRDQTRAIRDMFLQDGLRVAVQLPDTDMAEVAAAEHCLVPLDAEALDLWQEHYSIRSRSEVLERLLSGDKRSRIVLTNPDILYLILEIGYRAKALAELGHYSTLVLDEFHLYTGVELANALFMLHLAEKLGFFKRRVLLSATMSPSVTDLLDRLFQIRTIGTDTPVTARQVGVRTCNHEIELQIVPGGHDKVATICDLVANRPRDATQAATGKTGMPYIPVTIILNSVINAIWLRDELVRRATYASDEILEIRGLSNRAIRQIRRQRIVIGTSSITVGVDFDASLLIFEASDNAEFLQRLGRLGRHRPGEAVFVCDLFTAKRFESLDDKTVSREELEATAKEIFPPRAVYDSFPATRWGLLAVMAMVDNIEQRVKSGPPHGADTDITAWLAGCLGDFVEKLGAHDEYRRAQRLRGRDWYRAYVGRSFFRSSVPSLEVIDYREVGRRGGDRWLGTYDADLKTVLERARGLDYDPDAARWVVKGYGTFRSVHLSDARIEVPEVDLLDNERVKNWQFVLQDGSRYPLSDFFGANHVYGVVPRALKPMIDWRLPCFECGEYLVGFDGTALLLQSVYESAAPSFPSA